jgi:hypothetical protein
VLRAYYGGLDLGAFLDQLRGRGFVVPDRARANYSQTFLAVASTLNMAYLDPVGRAVPAGSRDRRPLKRLIDDNALMRLARAAGYQVVVVGSNYSATERIAAADLCLCERNGLHQLDRAAMALTPLAALPLSTWAYDAHRRAVLASLEGVRRAQELPGRKFVFAHVISPHAPFVFSADGKPRQPSGTLSDDTRFGGSKEEYVAGYREQVRYLAGRLVTLVDDLLAPPGPTPVVVIHADHGPASMLSWEDPGQTNMHERLSIFAAYRFPGEPRPDIAATVSPINGARLLANRYLGSRLPLLPDESFFSTWSRPYEFLPVSTAGR